MTPTPLHLSTCTDLQVQICSSDMHEPLVRPRMAWQSWHIRLSSFLTRLYVGVASSGVARHASALWGTRTNLQLQPYGQYA